MSLWQAGYRCWYFARDDSDRFRDQYERAIASLRDRHWAAEVVGRGLLRQDDLRGYARRSPTLPRRRPDVVLLLTDWHTQLDLLSRYQAAG